MPTIRGTYRWFIRHAAFNTPTFPDGDCIYVVPDPTARINQVQVWPTKEATDNYIYRIDWGFYAADDPIVASEWTTDGGLQVWQESFESTITSIFVGFGKHKAICNLTNTVTLTSTAEYTQVVKLKIDNIICSPRYIHGPGGAELACQ